MTTFRAVRSKDESWVTCQGRGGGGGIVKELEGTKEERSCGCFGRGQASREGVRRGPRREGLGALTGVGLGHPFWTEKGRKEVPRRDERKDNSPLVSVVGEARPGPPFDFPSASELVRVG